MLLVVGAPGQLLSLAGQEHGRTITLASLRHRQLPQCERLFDHLVGAAKEREWDGEAKSFRSLEIDE